MSKIKKLQKSFQEKGLGGVAFLFKSKLFPKKTKIIKGFDTLSKYFDNKIGIEIGGPSLVFSREVPIYPLIQKLDGCNFSRQTIWEGQIKKGATYSYYKEKSGYQYICEANNLKDIPSEKYDFLVSSHCLEHCANTIQTTKEWLRVLKKGGLILTILPDKRYTFDQNRPTTTFEHLLSDYDAKINESDLTHLEEILELHDLSRDLRAGTKEEFKIRSEDNFNNRCLHHHVFDFDVLTKLYNFNNIKIIDAIYAAPDHQIIIGIKQ